jgi:hypothetical protein
VVLLKETMNDTATLNAIEFVASRSEFELKDYIYTPERFPFRPSTISASTLKRGESPSVSVPRIFLSR